MKSLVWILCGTALALAGTKLGKPLTMEQPMTVEQLQGKAAQLTGKTVQVKGKVTEVCQMMGCWMALASANGGATIRIKVDDGDIVFPKEAVGKMAIAEGKLDRLELTREEAIAHARHEAEERGRKFDESKIKSGKVVYQIAGSGAVILE
jgi:hypothetical protein